MSREILGIDIRNHHVAALLLKSGLKKRRIEAYARVSFEPSEDIRRPIAACLDDITAQAPLSSAVCIISLPASRISFRNMTVPFESPKKIHQILAYELEPTLPQAVDDVIIDFYATRSDGSSDLVAAAVAKKEIEWCLSALADYSLDPEIITVGGLSTVQCLAHIEPIPSDSLYLDSDDGQLTIGLLGPSGQIRFVRNITVGPFTPTFIESIDREIHRSIDAFVDIGSADFSPETLFLSENDGPGHIIGDHMCQHNEFDCKSVDPFNATEVSIADGIGQQWTTRQMRHAFALAFAESEGLKLLNFRRGPFAVKKKWLKYKTGLITTAVLSLMILLSFMAGILVESHAMQKQIDRLDAQIRSIFQNRFPDVTRIVDPLQQMRSRMDSARNKFTTPGIGSLGLRRIDILNDISRLISPQTNIDLNRIVIGPESVMLYGDTNTFNAVNLIKGELERGAAFDTVTISSANIDKSDSRVRFKMMIQLGSGSSSSRRVSATSSGG